MPEFIFAYHGGGMPDTPEEGERMMAAWQKWYEDMGPALKNPGAAAAGSMTVTASGVAEGGGANPISGYTVVDAADMDAACALAKGCPMLSMDGASVEVAPLWNPG